MAEPSFKTGEFTRQYVYGKDGHVLDAQVEPNGVEVHMERVEKLKGSFGLRNGVYDAPYAEDVELQENEQGMSFWEIGPGAYEATTREVIEIPDGHVGIAFPGSRLPRSGIWVTQPLWDTGFKGKGKVTLFTLSDWWIKSDFRPFQIALVKADNPEELYDGVHQGREN